MVYRGLRVLYIHLCVLLRGRWGRNVGLLSSSSYDADNRNNATDEEETAKDNTHYHTCSLNLVVGVIVVAP
jgi:hypothetical protein